jgi:hypothetical protein
MNDKLHDALKNWSERKRPTDEHMRQLTGRITSEASRLRHEEAFEAYVPFRMKFGYAALGAAVALAVSCLCLFSGIPRRPVDSEAPARLAEVQSDRIEAGRLLFAEMDRLFADNLRWVAESGGDMGLGVGSLPGGTVSDAEPVLVRLVVLTRDQRDASWRSVWDANVLLRGEERIEVVPNRNLENKLALWVYHMKGGELAVDADFSLDVPVRLAARINTVVRQGEPEEILRVSEDGIEYRVFQTVSVLTTKA